MRRPVLSSVVTALVLLGCQAEPSEQTREVIEQAKQGVEQGVEQAKQGAKQGVEQAKQGIAEARERYAVDERATAAREQFSASMDEAAESFAELAAAGREQASKVGAAAEQRGKAGIEGAAEAISCAPDPNNPAATRCLIRKQLIDKLQSEPKLLARELEVAPKQGVTGKGLELVAFGERSVPELLGLSPHDILLEFNGVSLGSFEAIRLIDEALAGKYAAELIYERDGERKTLLLERVASQ